MSVSITNQITIKTKSIVKLKKKNLSVATHIQYCLQQFSMRYSSKSLRTKSPKLGFV